MKFIRRLERWLLTVSATLLTILLLTSVPASAEVMKAPVETNRPTRAIESQLICQCGCTMVVEVCDCGTAENMRKDILSKMNSGMSDKQILADYMTQYGEKVLAYPEKKGFNWAAWITPFVAIVAGAALLYFILRNWVRSFNRSDAAAAPSVRLSQEEERLYDSKLQDVIKKHF